MKRQVGGGDETIRKEKGRLISVGDVMGEAEAGLLAAFQQTFVVAVVAVIEAAVLAQGWF